MRPACSSLGGTLSEAYANENILDECGKLHIRGRACIIRLSTQLVLNMRVISSGLKDWACLVQKRH